MSHLVIFTKTDKNKCDTFATSSGNSYLKKQIINLMILQTNFSYIFLQTVDVAVPDSSSYVTV